MDHKSSANKMLREFKKEDNTFSTFWKRYHFNYVIKDVIKDIYTHTHYNSVIRRQTEISKMGKRIVTSQKKLHKWTIM